MKHSTSRGLWVVALIGAGMLIGIGNAHGQVIFDNLFTASQGFRPVTASIWEAQRFNSDSTNLQLTSATLTLFAGSGSGSVFIRLFADAAGQPGTSLATLYDGPAPATGDVVFGGLSQPLTPNTNYWVVLGEDAGTVLDFRWGATSSAAGTGTGFQIMNAVTSNQGTSWTVANSAPHKMQLTASPIPEPASLLLGLIGSGGLLLVRRRKQH